MRGGGDATGLSGAGNGGNGIAAAQLSGNAIQSSRQFIGRAGRERDQLQGAHGEGGERQNGRIAGFGNDEAAISGCSDRGPPPGGSEPRLLRGAARAGREKAIIDAQRGARDGFRERGAGIELLGV